MLLGQHMTHTMEVPAITLFAGSAVQAHLPNSDITYYVTHETQA